MLINLPAFPDYPEFGYVTTLGGRVRLDFAWNQRTESWYLSATDLTSGDTLLTGARVSPGRAPLAFHGYRLPVIYFDGPDPYPQNALGVDRTDGVRVVVVR